MALAIGIHPGKAKFAWTTNNLLGLTFHVYNQLGSDPTIVEAALTNCNVDEIDLNTILSESAAEKIVKQLNDCLAQNGQLMA